MNNIYEDSIILIGGMAIGKSTTAELLQKQLGLPIISSDAIRCEILENTPGYSFEKQLEIRNKTGYTAEMEYLIPYSILAINQILDNLTTPCIIDFGALFGNELTEDLMSKIRSFRNVILLYSTNPVEILKRRNIETDSEIGRIYLATLTNPIYDLLATKKINIDSKAPEEILNDIRKYYSNKRN